MGVNLIFKIAAVGILVSVICQVLKHSGRDEPGVSHQPGGAGTGALLDRSLHI